MEVKTDMTTNTYPNKPSRTVGKIAKRTRESRNNQKTNLRAKELNSQEEMPESGEDSSKHS